ncbi:MAG: CAP domain-containing protein [Verrucomicrobiota bacterium]
MSSLPHPRFFRSSLLGLGAWVALAAPGHCLTPYEFGNPTGEEQQYIELINRARANPPAEGTRLAATTDPIILTAYSYFSVNLAMLQTEFNAIAVQPPLAPNASLTTSARGHSAWMLANALQSHDETNPANTFDGRITAAGYWWSTVGENIFATARSVWHGHAGFQVDWGGGTGGMQSPRGHRNTIHSADFHEIGVGVTLGTNSISSNTVGPQLVTQDFGTSFTNPTLATGVAYYDLDSSGSYDAGEGIAGLTVNINGTGVTQYCTTALGGGWVVPIPSTATTRTVTFSGLNLNQSASLVVPAATNCKTDLKLTYAPPSITSAATASTGLTHTLTFTGVGGATAYQWNRWATTTAATETCDSAATVTSATTGSYSIHNTTVIKEGSASFHLANPTGADQVIQLNALYYGQSSPTLAFQSQIRNATLAERFKVQVKEEGSVVWQDVFSQTGSGGAGESVFTQRSAALGSMLGKSFRVRFLLYSTGSYYPNYSGDSFGWFIDAITFTGVASLTNVGAQTLSGTSGSFTPNAGTWLMSLAPVISSREFPAAYQTLSVTAMPPAPAILSQPVSPTITKNTSTTVTVIASGYSLSYQWYSGTTGTLTNPISGATTASYTTPVLTTTTSYWVRVTNVAGFVNSKTAQVTASTKTVTRSFATWASEIETANTLTPGSIANVLTDYDHDGRSNLIEYAFGTSPIVGNDAAPRMPIVIANPANQIIQYQRDTALTDVTVTAQACTNLGSWKAPGDAGALTGFSDALITTTGTVQTRQASVPRSSGSKIFLRLRVTQP